MTEINIGDICRYCGTDTAWVARARDGNGRWLCTAKQVDLTRKSAFTCIQAGEGDLVVAVPRPTWLPGAQLQYQGAARTVIEDTGDFLMLSVPAYTHETKGGDGLHVPASRVEVSKSDVVLDQLL